MSVELELLSAFLVGLMGGLHCVGMCGGISGALTNAVPAAKQQHWAGKFAYQVSFNSGRILSYGLAGALVGILGSGIYSELAPKNLTGLRVFAGVMLILLGLYISNWWKVLSRLEQAGAGVWRKISPLTKRLLPVDTLIKALAMGMLWGWLPCGLVYSSLALAMASGSASGGALTMIAFGLGTFPAVISVGYFSQLYRGLAHSPMARTLVALFLIAYGCWIIMSIVSGHHHHHHH